MEKKRTRAERRRDRRGKNEEEGTKKVRCERGGRNGREIREEGERRK